MSLVIHQYAPGDASTLTVEREDVPLPGRGQVRLRQRAIGVNFIDLAFRAGAFGADGFPLTIGIEAAGDIEAIGAGVDGFEIGDRVAYPFSPGASAEVRLIGDTDLIRLPDRISYVQAAAMTTKGLTAGAMITKAHLVRAGETILVQAAAGGVGSILSRWAKAKGATVIGVVGSESKILAAKANGIDHVFALNSGTADDIDRLTAGRGVDAVFDGVGRDTIRLSLQAVAPSGSVILTGGASGQPEPDRALIDRKRIRYSSPSLYSLVSGQQALQSLADELYGLVLAGDLGELPVTTYPLEKIGRAHQDLETRRSVGALVLTV